jgi:hypothetical protein
VFFIKPSDLRVSDETEVAVWLKSMKDKYPFLNVAEHQEKPEAEKFARKLLQDLSRRQQGEKRRLELHPWIQIGPDILRELDAAERSAELKHGSRDLEVDLRTLSDRLKTLGRHVSQRLDRIALADLAIGNLRRGHEHFVGRHKELRQLHDIMVTGGPQSGGSGMGGRGMIAATFAPGGMGKTALARQYAHAYAEFGRWFVKV